MRKTIPIVVVLTLTICFCVFHLWNISSQQLSDSHVKDDMQKYKPLRTSAAAQPLSEPFPETAPEPSKPELSDYEEALSELVEIETEEPEMKPPANPFIIAMQTETNADIIGWINIPGTNVDYPIIQTADNDFYLRRNIYKEDATAGCIFMDYRCNANLAHYNTIIYGHNMKNRSMFGDLRLFSSEEFFEENQYGTIYTAFGTYTIRFFAFMVVSSDDEQIYTNPSSPEAFHDYIKENARNYREPENRDRVITLSTCSKEFENARGVLLAYIATET